MGDPPSGDTVRRDFITAYMNAWNVSREYAENMMQHVELGAVERAQESTTTTEKS